MKKILLLFVLLGCEFMASSQTTAVEGTFQLMTSNEKARQVFTTDIYSIVENNREINNDVAVKLDDYTWLRILYLNTINSPSFTPNTSKNIVTDEKDPLNYI